MTHEDRELLAGLARAHTAMLSLGLRIMDSSTTEQRSDCADVSDPAHPFTLGNCSGEATTGHTSSCPFCNLASGLRRKAFISKVQEWPCAACGGHWWISMVSPRPAWLFLDHLSGTVDLAAARSVLREIITLGDQATGLTDEQLRFRLLTLAGHTASKSPASRSPIGRWSSDTPESAPSGRLAPPEIVPTHQPPEG